MILIANIKNGNIASTKIFENVATHMKKYKIFQLTLEL